MGAMDAETAERVLQMARDGVPYGKIAKLVGFTYSAVQRRASLAGIVRINRARPGDIIDDYKNGYSIRDIMTRRKTSFSAAIYILKAYGIPMRPSGGQVTNVSTESIVGLREAGWTFARIGATYNLSPKSVFARYARWKNRKSSPGTSKPNASAPATSPPSRSASRRTSATMSVSS